MVATDFVTEPLRSLWKKQIGCLCLKVVRGGCSPCLRRRWAWQMLAAVVVLSLPDCPTHKRN